MRTVFFVAIVALLSSACSHHRAMEVGDRYYAEGNYYLAEQKYQNAVIADPDSEEARTKHERARRKFVEGLRDETRQALESGQYVKAIRKAEAAHFRLPKAQTTWEIVEMVLASVRSQASALRKAGNLDEASFLWKEIRDRLPPFEEEAARALEALISGQIDTLVVRAQKAEAQEFAGAALLYWAKIAQIKPSPYHRAQYEKRREKVREAVAFPVSIEPVRSRLDDESVMRLEHRFRGGLSVADSPSESRAHLAFEVDSPTFHTTEGSRSETKKYQSGTRDVPNPRHAELQQKLEEHESELAELEAGLARKDAAVIKEQEKITTATANMTSVALSIAALGRERDALATRVQRQSKRVEEARLLLRETPTTVKEPVYSDFVYEVRTVTRHAETKVKGTIKEPHRDQTTFEIPVRNYLRDTGHDAYPKIDLAADSIVFPSDRSVESELSRTVGRALHERILERFHAHQDGYLERGDHAASESERMHFYVLHVAAKAARAQPRVVRALASEIGLEQSAITSLGFR